MIPGGCWTFRAWLQSSTLERVSTRAASVSGQQNPLNAGPRSDRRLPHLGHRGTGHRTLTSRVDHREGRRGGSRVGSHRDTCSRVPTLPGIDTMSWSGSSPLYTCTSWPATTRWPPFCADRLDACLRRRTPPAARMGGGVRDPTRPRSPHPTEPMAGEPVQAACSEVEIHGRSADFDEFVRSDVLRRRRTQAMVDQRLSADSERRPTLDATRPIHRTGRYVNYAAVSARPCRKPVDFGASVNVARRSR